MPGTFRKAWEVVKSSRTDFDVDTGKRKLKFGKSGGMILNDSGEAKAVEERYGAKSKFRRSADEAVVVPVDDVRVEAGHKYTFGRHPGVPWAEYDEFGRRIPDEKGEEDADSENERPDGDAEATKSD
jgi:hypothetical protein